MSDTVFFTRTTAQASIAKAAGIRILTLAAAACALFRDWRHNYRSRRELASLARYERYDLNFVGEVDAEIVKPFWRK